MADDREWTLEDSSEELWAAIDELRAKRDKLVTINRTEAMSFTQRTDMFKRQMATAAPAMKQSVQAQLRMIEQQKTFSEQNFQRNTRAIDTKIETINRLLEEKKVRDQRQLEEGLQTVQQDVVTLKATTQALAGQIDVLKTEARERKADFDKSIAAIRDEAKSASEMTEDMCTQIYALQAQSQLLMAEYDAKQADLREKQYIEENPTYAMVYSTIFSKVNEVFVASKALASGMVTREKYSDGDRAAQYMTLLSESVPFPGANLVLGCITNRVQALSDKREEDRVANITSNANSFSEMDEICDTVARGLVFAYEEQLCAMTRHGASVFSECLVRGVLEFLSTPPYERGVPSDDDASTASLVAQIVTFFGRRDYVKREAAIEKMTGCMPFADFAMFHWFNKKTPTASTLERSRRPVPIECRLPKDVPWTDVGILQLSGIRTREGDHYDGDAAQPHVYGYRLASARDAALLGYFSAARQPGYVVPLNDDQLSRNPEAHTKFWRG
ncbi:hypothetical protein SDRG_02748 [Saprolegnia diclina VS20]|uniref:Uncharacterized protein n=1 Tax=Saprolegnia diclina (strain VS20) TaxID=1156394 RepID=T0QPQ3_SAPDV|nr:hypothetical protein SDRG_02748 [Saprolegnia diclina VS20]EQC40094.1 hypothetical protein SDRG_02748 [Saprolegnia diclina VS20]|eukprot:XP_008606568.1 hypothetical protein SDRG_02748 [Saprolegnia diclina VS20]